MNNEPFVVKNGNRIVKIRLVDASDKYHDEVLTEKAIDMAREAKLDLVCFSPPQDDKPLCKIIDFGKWKYHQKKSQHKQIKDGLHHKKEIRFSPVIAIGDIQHKLKKAKDIFKHGDVVTFVMDFKNPRYKAEAESKVEAILEMCSDFAQEASRKSDRRRIIVKMNPKHTH